MACGLPVIASDISGIPELVVDGQNGFLTPPNNEEAIAGKMEILLKSKEMIKKMGKDGRDTVINHYNINSWNDTASMIYTNIAKKYK